MGANPKFGDPPAFSAALGKRCLHGGLPPRHCHSASSLCLMQASTFCDMCDVKVRKRQMKAFCAALASLALQTTGRLLDRHIATSTAACSTRRDPCRLVPDPAEL